jgi:hypothetical protein
MDANVENGSSNVVLPVKVGDKVMVRTVTYHYTGEIADVSAWPFVRLTKAAWIADSGRFMDALVTGNFKEVEPFPRGTTVNWMTVVDCSPVETLPEKQIG